MLGFDDGIGLAIGRVGVPDRGREDPWAGGVGEGGRSEGIGQPDVDRNVGVSIGRVGRAGAGERDPPLPAETRRRGEQAGPEEIADPLVAVLPAGVGVIGGIVEPSIAVFDARRQCRRQAEVRARRDADADRAEIIGPSKQHCVANCVGVKRHAAIIAQGKSRARRDFGETEVEPRHLELLRIIDDPVRLPAVAALIAKVVEIMSGGEPEDVPVGRALELTR